MKQQLAKAEQNYNRSGPVRYTVQEIEGKASVISLAVAYEEAPVPANYYVADFYQVVSQDLAVLLIFGKLDHPNVEKLRNKIEIYFPAEMFVRQLWKGSRDFEKTLESYVEHSHTQAIGPGTVSAQADKVQTLHSNNVLMVLSAGHCMMDFFYISAKELWLRPPKNEPIGIEALVRVIASGAFVLGLLRECDKVAQELIERLGIEFEENDNAAMESK
ncbi:MAG TPA: hypothetical protein VII95_09595 [Terriglobales bacterium]